MKKSIVVATSLSAAVIMLAGCGTADTSAKIAEKINKNLNVLGSTIKKMDTIDNSYLANQDLAYFEDGVQVNAPPKQYEVQYLAIRPEPARGNVFALNKMTRMPYDGQVSQIKQQLDSCVGGQCVDEQCDVYTSSNGSCCTTEEYTYNCGDQNVNDILKKLLEQKLIDSIGGTDCTSTDDGGYCVTRTSVNEENNTLTVHKMQYTPGNEEDTQAQKPVSRYMQRVQGLYQMTNNVVNANNTLSECREDILESIDEMKGLVEELKTNENISMQQLQALNNYVYDIKTSINRLKNANGQLSNEISNISNNYNYGVAKSIDVMNSNYMRILNHLDIRIAYLRNTLSTLDQMKYIIMDVMVNQEIGDDIVLDDTIVDSEIKDDYTTEVEDNVELDAEVDKEMGVVPEDVLEDDFAGQPTEDQSVDDVVEDSVVEDVEDQDVETNANIDTENNLDEDENVKEENNKNIENVEENTEIDEEFLVDDNIDVSGNNLENNNTNDIDNDNNTSIDDNNNLENITNNNEENSNMEENNETSEEKETRSSTLIDTYNEDLYSNLDLDEKMKQKRENANQSTTNQDTLVNNDTTTNNTQVNDTVVDNNNNQLVNDNTTTGNSVVNGTNPMGYEIGQNHNDINVPNGTFQNEIITQNNLSNGLPGHGSTTANGLPNDDNDKNINTYGYNTIIDMVNRGTVNNGINTL